MARSAPVIACNTCKVPLEGPAEPKPQDVFTCPSCGLSDTHEAVMREISDVAFELLSHGVQKELVAVTKGKGLEFKPNKLPNLKSHRFTLIEGH